MSTGQDCCASALTAWTLFAPLSECGISPLVAIVLLTTRVASGEEHGATTIRAPDLRPQSPRVQRTSPRSTSGRGEGEIEGMEKDGTAGSVRGNSVETGSVEEIADTTIPTKKVKRRKAPAIPPNHM